MANRRESFVSEPLEPVAGSADAALMSRGQPGPPRHFRWRGREYRVTALLETWKTAGGCRHGSGELYVRRHWHRIRTEPEAEMVVYCDRQARDRNHPTARWWVYTVAARA